MLLKLFHHDIRATLSQYSRNLRELSALFGDIPAIRCAFNCNIMIIYKDTYCKYYSNIYMDNKLCRFNYFHIDIFKNIKYKNNLYYANNMISYNKNEILISNKYKIGLVYFIYVHYITRNLYISIKTDKYYIVGNYAYICNSHNNEEIIDMINSAIKKYKSRFN